MPQKQSNIQNNQNFLDKFSYQVLQFSQSQKLIAPQDKILVSISGGLDSTSLFRLLHSFRLKVELDLHLVHFHHGLRKESDEEEVFVRQLADKFNTPITVVKIETLTKQRGLQEKARTWRYEQLNKILNQLGFNKIALGHHLDDLVETQLWKLSRGTSLFALNPIQPVNPPYIRPLLRTSKQDLAHYLDQIGQEWREDHSNLSDDYTRNLIRNQIVPLLNRCAGGSLSQKMLAISEDANHLNDLFDETFPPSCYQCEKLHYEQITHHNKLLACELIHRFLLYHQQTEINRENLERIYGLVRQGKGNWTITLKGNGSVKGSQKEVYIEKEG